MEASATAASLSSTMWARGSWRPGPSGRRCRRKGPLAGCVHVQGSTSYPQPTTAQGEREEGEGETSGSYFSHVTHGRAGAREPQIACSTRFSKTRSRCSQRLGSPRLSHFTWLRLPRGAQPRRRGGLRSRTAVKRASLSSNVFTPHASSPPRHLRARHQRNHCALSSQEEAYVEA